MLKPITILVLVLIFMTTADFIVKGNVKKRNTVIKINDNFPRRCLNNNSVFRNNDTLKRIVLESKYIFTGKISSEQKRKRGKFKRSIFKVFVRRVLKGDFGALSEILNFETRTFNSSNRAYLLAESSAWRRGCVGHSQGWGALLFSAEFSSPLKLLVDPVPSNIDIVRRVKSAIKGNYCFNLLTRCCGINISIWTQITISILCTFPQNITQHFSKHFKQWTYFI